MTERRALLAGATGLVGGYGLDELLDSNRYATITALTRRPLERRHHTLREVTADFDRLDTLGDRLAADDVFCCLGTTIRRAGSPDAFRRVDFDYPLALARAARLHGTVQFVIVSSLGADPDARTFYLRVKGELERALSEVGMRTLVVVRPSLLLGSRRESRPAEAVGKLVLSAVAPLLVGRLARYRPIHARDVARAMVQLAARGLTGLHTFESDELRALARHTGAPPSG